MNSTEEGQFVVCDSCGMVNGCEHYYMQDQEINNLMSESFSVELENSENNIQTETTDETISEMLISFVSLRPALWNHRLPLIQRTKTIKEHLWTEIVSEYGGNTDLTPTILQKKWKNLRDKFIKTKNDLETYTPSGSGAKKKKKIWKHFNSMAFLNDTISPRITISSHSTESGSLPSAPASPILSSPTSTISNQGDEVSPKLYKRKKTGKDEEIASSILNAIDKIACDSVPVTISRKENPICQRISELLEIMPPREKAELEINLLSITYDAAKKYMQ